MHDSAGILLTLFIIFVAAQIGGEIAQRLKLPGVVGEIAAGCAIGPSALGWVALPDIGARTPLEVLTEIEQCRITERGATRADDKFSEATMEDRKREGYF